MPHELSDEQLKFLRTYVALEQKLHEQGEKRGPSINEMLPLTNYADRSGVQHMREKLIELGYIRPREVVEAGSTVKAKRALSKLSNSNGSSDGARVK
jgi:hypothetical protein